MKKLSAKDARLQDRRHNRPGIIRSERRKKFAIRLRCSLGADAAKMAGIRLPLPPNAVVETAEERRQSISLFLEQGN